MIGKKTRLENPLIDNPPVNFKKGNLVKAHNSSIPSMQYITAITPAP